MHATLRPIRRLLFAALLLLLPALAIADSGDRPRLRIASEVSIDSDRIYLGEIATIRAKHKEHDAVVAALKEINLGEAPAPRMSTVVSGVKILAAIEAAGIPSDTLGYAIPRLVNVTRAGRVLTKKEVLDAVAASLRKDASLDVKVRDVRWTHGQVVPEGTTTFEVARVGQLNGGKVPLKINALIDGESAARFLATAVVDDWREVPVLNKTLERGMLISPSDVELVRLNLFKQPADIVAEVDSLVGKRLKSRISAGGPIRESFIDIPPTIVQGKRVTMRYSSGGLLATASGVAMQDGLRGQRIRVKNDSSSKIIRGIVIDENNVEVSVE